jgi:hypothetical protein
MYGIGLTELLVMALGVSFYASVLGLLIYIARKVSRINIHNGKTYPSASANSGPESMSAP